MVYGPELRCGGFPKNRVTRQQAKNGRPAGHSEGRRALDTLFSFKLSVTLGSAQVK